MSPSHVSWWRRSLPGSLSTCGSSSQTTSPCFISWNRFSALFLFRRLDQPNPGCATSPPFPHGYIVSWDTWLSSPPTPGRAINWHTLALSLGRHSVMEAGAGLTKTGPLGNRSPRTPLFDGTPSFPDSRCLPYWAKQTARRQPFVLYAGVMTTSNHNVPWHTSTHSPPEPRLRSDKPATGQLVGQKTFASLGIRGRAFSRILVHTGMFA